MKQPGTPSLAAREIVSSDISRQASGQPEFFHDGTGRGGTMLPPALFFLRAACAA